MNAISVRDLTKKYGDYRAVDHISFDVEEGEFFALLGENGAGKSTTINMLCTIIEKTEGNVKFFGYELGKDDDDIRRSIGVVFQHSVLDRKLTVKENLYTRGSYYGLKKDDITRRLEAFMEYLELKSIWNQKYESLSGGQRRRVDIVRALINNPRILFLDEPTTGLDPLSRKLVWDYINYLRKEKHMTIFLTTHYMEEVRDAGRVIILEKGKIIADDTPAGLKTRFAANKFIWYVEKSDKHTELIKNFKYTYNVDHYVVTVPQTDTFDITRFVYDNRLVIKDYEIIKGSMDDVFLNLTGRNIGDE